MSKEQVPDIIKMSGQHIEEHRDTTFVSYIDPAEEQKYRDAALSTGVIAEFIDNQEEAVRAAKQMVYSEDSDRRSIRPESAKMSKSEREQLVAEGARMAFKEGKIAVRLFNPAPNNDLTDYYAKLRDLSKAEQV